MRSTSPAHPFKLKSRANRQRAAVGRNRLRIFEQLENRFLLTSAPIADFGAAVDEGDNEPVLYFSLTGRADLSGISETVRDEDIVAYNGTDFEMLFDGSDVGLTSQDLNAFTLLGDGSIVMSFTSEATIGSLGLVDDSDVVRFVPSELGETTAGTFELYFDGSDVGLTTNSEDVNGLEILSDGTLLISTKDVTNVPGAFGVAEDLFAFQPTSLGETTSGTWTHHFDGSDVGLFGIDEDVDGVAIGPDDKYYFSTRDDFSVAGVSGANEDVFTATPTALGTDTSALFEPFLDGSTFLLASKDINALDIPNGAPTRPAVAVEDAYVTDEDSPLVVSAGGVLANDDGGGPQTAVLVNATSNGALALSADGSFTYTPHSNFNGSDSFVYRALNATSSSNVATVTITVVPVNDAPVAESQTHSIDEDTPLSISLTASDIEGDGLTYSIVSGPAAGALSGQAPNLTYTPEPDFNGSDGFTFRANDGTTDSAVVSVSISVSGVNDPPTAAAQTVATKEATTRSITLTGSDVEDDSLTYSIASHPMHGSLSGTAPNLSYTPDPGYSGPDSFAFIANDGQSDSLPAAVSIVVVANNPPVAHPQSIATNEDTATPVTLAGSDADGDPIVLSLVDGPSSGMLSGTAPNLVYTPATDFHGSDSFTFKSNDGTSDSIQATVHITVNPVNDAPVVSELNAKTAEETAVALTLTGGTDIDGDPLSYSVLSGPEHGSLSGTSPNLIYTPADGYHGWDSFTFQAHDGTAVSGVADFLIEITPVNDTPSAQGQTLAISEDTSTDITLNASDPDGDPFDYIILEGPLTGVLTGTAPNLTYTPQTNFNGVDNFTFRVNDGTENSPAASVLIFINEVNDAPVADGQLLTTHEGDSIPVTLSGSDVDGDPLEYEVISGPENGSLQGVAPNLTYVPSPYFHGSDRFFFRVSDGSTDSFLAKVTVLVYPVNDAPVADSQSITTFEDEPIGMTITGSDADGHALSYQVVSSPANGTLSGTAPDLTYTPAPNFNGLDSFTFKTSDGVLDSEEATVLISVNPVNDPPLANLVTAFVNEDSSVEVTLSASDIDGDTLSYTVISDPLNGTLSGAAPNLIYTPYPDFNGLDSFAFGVDDGAGGTDMSGAVIRVFPVDERVPNISDLSLWVNGIDNPNRSGVSTITVDFGQDVWVDSPTVLNIFNQTSGIEIETSEASLENNGTPQVTWDLSTLDLPTGRYTAEVTTTGVVGVEDQATLASPYTAEFYVLPGDGNGDRVVNFLDYMAIQNSFGRLVGTFGPGDYDGNAVVNVNDFYLLQNNYNAWVSPATTDFGDAPQSGTLFPTTLDQDGARHALGSTLYLGSGVDGEPDGQPTANAMGDDDASGDDGVSVTPIVAGTVAYVQVTASVPSGAATLNAWVDFNANGDWSDPGEQVFVNRPLTDGVNELSVSVPVDAAAGTVFARFRLTSTPGYSYQGLAPDGEVEDYEWTILPALLSEPPLLVTFAAAVFAETDSNNPSTLEQQDESDQANSGGNHPEAMDLALLEVTASPPNNDETAPSSTLDEDLVDQVFDDSQDLLEQDGLL